MNKLKELRTKSGLTQKNMANHLKIAISAYNYYENGVRKIPLKHAEKIAKLFSVEISDIFLPNSFTVSKTKKPRTP